MIQRNVFFPRALSVVARRASSATLALCATLLGCSDHSINMGEGVPVVEEPAPPSSSRCADDPVLEGDVVVSSQEELDALEGCQRVNGDLIIEPFEGAHLRSLHALEAVSGALKIGDVVNLFEPSDPRFYELARLQVAWLSSLEGLEALESADSLTVYGLTSADVRPLARLGRLTRGSLTFASAANLRSFDGLQSLTGVTSLYINNCDQLMSFDGLTLPGYMNWLHVSGADLRELQPLGITWVDGMTLESTRLHNLTAFSGLLDAREGISVKDNKELESLAGLDALQTVGTLTLWNNRVLASLPSFDQLYRVENLHLVSNPRLAQLPTFPALTSPEWVTELDPTQALTGRLDVISVFNMPGLTTFTVPRGVASASVIKFTRNPNLRQIEFTQQSYIEYLSLHDNPLLETVSTGALERVTVLNLADNPLLPATTFDGVRRLDTTSSSDIRP